jgi:Zn-dependent M28 family amino/carboxypeptidase
MLSACASTDAPDCAVEITAGWSVPDLPLRYLHQAPRKAADRERRVYEYFESAGCPVIDRQPIPRRRSSNIICEIPGSMDAVLVIGAHFDKLGPGRGIADNWTGITALASIAEHYANNPPRHTMRLIAFGLEEADMRGAEFYVKEIRHGRQARPALMVNIDTLGVDDLHVDVRSSADLQCQSMAVAQSLNLPLSPVRIEESYGDWQPFQRAGIPVLQFHSLNRQALTLLHTYRDNESLVDRQKMRDAFAVIAATISVLDSAGVDEAAIGL